MSESPAVSIVMVNWNGRPHLARCLPSLMAQTWQDFEIVLVDNGSADGSAAFVREQFPPVRLIQNESNLGFAGPSNQGIAAARGRYVVTLNNDTELPAGWLAALVAAADAHPEMGAFACLVVFDERRDMIDSAGLAVTPAGIGCQRRSGEAARDVKEPEEVFGVCAAAAMYRRELLEDVGLFDESYFMYYEDVDLAWRARLRGWRALLVPGALVYHAHSGTSGRGSSFKEQLTFRNMVWSRLKNYPSPAWLACLPLMLAYDIINVCLPLVWGNTAPARGYWQGLRGARAALARRPAIQAGRAASFRHMLPWMRCFRRPLGGWQARRRTGRL
jgi:hypothetical protein